jgi:hypothetical protein
MSPPRKLLNRYVGPMSRQTVYETAEGLEVESMEGYEVTQQRVLFEDVQLVTYHRELVAVFLIVNGLMGAFFVGITILHASLTRGDVMWSLIWTAFAAPFLIALLLRLMFQVDVVTVFGRRSKARLRFSFRKKRAREIYGQICARVRQLQRGG